MTPVDVHTGDSPVVLGLPHTGTFVPEDVRTALNERGQGLDATDWHIETLYAGVLPGATTVRATFHRYVVDANRDPSGASLYPGQNTTGLVPLTDFDGRGIWTTPPDDAEIEARRKAYHAPYHAALRAALDRARDRHGVAILYDCHSIRSRIPFLFEGTLPDFSIGTNSGTTCAPQIEAVARHVCAAAPGFTNVSNGRFRGGWTTRHYGRPHDGLHALQMELAQSTYLQEEAAPWTYDADKAARLRPHLRRILTQLAALAPSLKGIR